MQFSPGTPLPPVPSPKPDDPINAYFDINGRGISLVAVIVAWLMGKRHFNQDQTNERKKKGSK